VKRKLATMAVICGAPLFQGMDAKRQGGVEQRELSRHTQLHRIIHLGIANAAGVCGVKVQAAAGGSRRQQAAAGGSRRQQAAAGGSRRQQAVVAEDRKSS
jgi:hypothetical protein